jgi:DNA-binding response OmpR family regulator
VNARASCGVDNCSDQRTARWPREAVVARILVVDDEPTIRSLVRDVLEEEGHEVLLAEDGYAGLRMIEQHRPDCVVLDVMMPGLDGHEVLQRVRASQRGFAVPIVMLTAAADDSHAWQAWTEGVDYFLPKPFEPLELLRFLDTLFPARPASLAG